ncbi:DUF4357 domain-containing protein [Devosia sp. A369]
MDKSASNISAQHLFDRVFSFSRSQIPARGKLMPDGKFVVLAGSNAVRQGTAQVKRDKPERDRLIREGVLQSVPGADFYVFAKDQTFGSPSSAAGVIQDGNASGPKYWTDPDSGKSLHELGYNRNPVK